MEVDGKVRKVKKGELLEVNDLIGQLAPASFERECRSGLKFSGVLGRPSAPHQVGEAKAP